MKKKKIKIKDFILQMKHYKDTFSYFKKEYIILVYDTIELKFKGILCADDINSDCHVKSGRYEVVNYQEKC